MLLMQRVRSYSTNPDGHSVAGLSKGVCERQYLGLFLGFEAIRHLLSFGDCADFPYMMGSSMPGVGTFFFFFF